MIKTRAAIQLAVHEPPVVDEIEVPDPGPGQVIVKMLSSGVCHSQLNQLHQEGLGRPLGLGHEGAGVVTHAGRGVDHVEEGDHVIALVVALGKTGAHKSLIHPPGASHIMRCRDPDPLNPGRLLTQDGLHHGVTIDIGPSAGGEGC